MSQYRIHVQPDNRTIINKNGQSILDTASRNGVKIRVGCKGGGCGICKIKVLEGEVDRGITSRSALSLEEIEQGYALSCQAKPKSDIVISYEKK
jgi:ferredoxin